MNSIVKKEDKPSFDQFGRCLVVDRSSAETLLTMLGCVNTEKWDTDFIVRSLRRVSLFRGVGEVTPPYQKLLDAIEDVSINGVIVIRSTRRQVTKPITLVDRVLAKNSHKTDASINTKKRKKKRVRGETFSFAKCGIPVGATLCLKKDPSITCTVIGDPWLVDFKDGVMKSFTERTRDLLGSKDSTYLSPMHYWLYNGKLLRVYYREVQCKDKNANKKDKSTTKEKVEQ